MKHNAFGNQRSFFRWLCVLILGMCVLGGCTSVAPTTPVPGAGMYCLREISNNEFRATLATSAVTYGPYNRGRIGGDSSICDLNRFYTLSVKFETKDGRHEDLTFDLVQIMRKFQAETVALNRSLRLYGSPRIEVRYLPDRISLTYRIVEYQEGGLENEIHLIKPPIISEFPILTYRLPSAARQP